MKIVLRPTYAVLTALCFLFSISAVAQQLTDRDFIRKGIKEWGECRTVALTEKNGDVAVYGENGSARSGCPKEMDAALTELYTQKAFISDVVLTEKGKWLICYGHIGFMGNQMPKALHRELTAFNQQKEIVNTVTFNDKKDWIVVTDKHFSSSSKELQQLLSAGRQSYGPILTVCLSNDACVLLFEKGYKYTGEVPASLLKALDETQLKVHRLKICGNAWFFADKEGKFEYEM